MSLTSPRHAFAFALFAVSLGIGLGPAVAVAKDFQHFEPSGSIENAADIKKALEDVDPDDYRTEAKRLLDAGLQAPGLEPIGELVHLAGEIQVIQMLGSGIGDTRFDDLDALCLGYASQIASKFADMIPQQVSSASQDDVWRVRDLIQALAMMQGVGAEESIERKMLAAINTSIDKMFEGEQAIFRAAPGFEEKAGSLGNILSLAELAAFGLADDSVYERILAFYQGEGLSTLRQIAMAQRDPKMRDDMLERVEQMDSATGKVREDGQQISTQEQGQMKEQGNREIKRIVTTILGESFGPGTCTETWLRPTASAETTPMVIGTPPIDTSAKNRRAVNHQCTASGGKLMPDGCPREGAEISCRIAMKNAELLLFIYAGSPELPEFRKFCSDEAVEMMSEGTTAETLKPLAASSKLFSACLER